MKFLFISSLSLIGFISLTFLKSNFITIDSNVNLWSASIQTASFTRIAEIIAYSFDTIPLILMSLVIATYFFYKNLKKDALLLVTVMAGNAAIVTMVKTLVRSGRPLNGIMEDSGYSFPSGHVTSSIVLFGLITYFIFRYWKSSNGKILLSAFFISLTLIVGFDRLYLNMHWLSDVIGGCFLGIFWLTFSILTFWYLERRLVS